MTMPTLDSGLQGLVINGAPGVQVDPFPAPSSHASGLVNGVKTDVSSVSFTDKIVITISQSGKLSQWIQVPLSSASPTNWETALPAAGSDLLPLGHLTPKTLMGGGGEERETMGHLYATQIASTIATKNPEETRTILVGFGLDKVDMARESFFDLLELLQKIL